MQSSRNLEKLWNRIAERYWEWHLGIQTHGVLRDGLDSDAVPYTPIAFRAFFRAMKHVPEDLRSGVFLDYGAGRGRALVLAARYYNFRRVIGVELSPELCEQATTNLGQVQARQSKVICCNAANYHPSPDTTVFFFYNPFFGETMNAVIRNLRDSLLENPRRAALVVCGSGSFMAATAGQDWFIEQASGKIMCHDSLNWRVFVTRKWLARNNGCETADASRAGGNGSSL
jgi:SAM-dependent methyltransferase